MLSERIRNMMSTEPFLTATPRTTVSEAARLMAQGGLGAVLVADADELVGIFTARDAIQRVLAPGRDAEATPLSDVMTRSPVTVGPEQAFGTALRLMQERGVHHMPVVEGSRPVGMLTARSALDPEMEDFVCEALRRDGYRAPLT